ncbi:MAG TPA: hypothetical protein VF664_09630 [Cystobacter sp.]
MKTSNANVLLSTSAQSTPDVLSFIGSLLAAASSATLAGQQSQGGPERYRDEAYVAELRRRAAILLPAVGWDEDPQIDEPVEAAKKDPSAPR